MYRRRFNATARIPRVLSVGAAHRAMRGLPQMLVPAERRSTLRRLTTVFSTVVIALAVALLVAPAIAQDSDADGAKALLDKGAQQYRDLAFSDAKATLLQVDKSKLAAAQAKQLDDLLGKVDLAIQRQTTGMEDYRKAVTAMEAGRFDEARTGFLRVAANQFTPKQTREDAWTLAAEAEAKIKQGTTAPPATRPAPPAPVEPVAPAPPAPVTPAPLLPLPAPVAPAPVPAPAPVTPEALPLIPTPAPAEPPPAEIVPAPAPQAAAPAPRQSLAEQAPDILRRSQAREQVQRGNLALQVNNMEQAQLSFERALELVPDMPEAKQGLERTRQLQTQVGPGDSLTELLKMRKVAQQVARVEFENAIKSANTSLLAADSATKYSNAAESARFAISILQTNRTYFPDDEYRTRMQDAQTLLDQIEQARTAYADRQLGLKLAESVKAASDRSRIEQQQLDRRVESLADTIEALEREGRYKQALDHVDEILRLQPNNSWAKGKKGSLEIFTMAVRQKEYRELDHRNEVKNFVELEATRIPWYEIITFPQDWPEITQRRAGTGAAGGESPANRVTIGSLEQVQPSFDFQANEFEQVVDLFRQIAGVNIVVNWPALEAAGVDKNTQVTISLANVTRKKALEEILSTVSTVVPLGYIVDEGIVHISTRDELSKKVETRVYDIRDLLLVVPDFDAGNVGIGSSGGTGTTGTTSGTTSGIGGGGSTGGGFTGGTTGGGFTGGGTTGGTGGGTTGTGTTNNQSVGDLANSILNMIRVTIDPVSWMENGGTGALQNLNGQLIVTQTPENHRKLVDLFKQLRDAQALQVNIEARFIQVSTGFLSDIGLDLDIFLNTGTTLTSTGVDPVTGATIVQRGSTALPQWNGTSTLSNNLTPLGFRQSSSSFTSPGSTSVSNSIGSMVTSANASALTVGGTFLDDIQVDFLIRATQADQRTTTLTAPRVTMFNGQQATVTISQEQAYVASLEPAVAENAVTFAPNVAVVSTGTSLTVRPVISADRRYVTMTLQPSVTVINGFNTYAISQTINPTTNLPTAQTGIVQLPTVTVQSVQTTVTVPDGGTLLIGGQMLAGEVQREMGVPILSKIPLINRFFTNRSMVRDESTLLILVKPTIIIPQEFEQTAFPG